MSLDAYRRTKLVILPDKSTVYQAARAMADNHIGAVLVSHAGELVGIVTDRDLTLVVLAEGRDPGITPLWEVMSQGVITCPGDAPLLEAVRLMREAGVRRIPLTDASGKPAGLVTFDDLILESQVGIEDLRAIIERQLVEVAAPLKPAGAAHPVTSNQPGQRMRAALRAEARAAQVYDRLLTAVADGTGLDRDRAERGLRLGACLLCHRLTPEEAQHTIAQLPSRLHGALSYCADGPDRTITSATMRSEIGRELALGEAEADEFLRNLFAVLSAYVSPGQMQEVRSQLPPDLAALFPERRRAA